MVMINAAATYTGVYIYITFHYHVYILPIMYHSEMQIAYEIFQLRLYTYIYT